MSIPLGLVPNQSAALAKLVPRAYFNNHEGHATFRYGSDRTAFTVALPQTRGRPSDIPSVTSQYASDLSLSINREIHPKVSSYFNRTHSTSNRQPRYQRPGCGRT